MATNKTTANNLNKFEYAHKFYVRDTPVTARSVDTGQLFDIIRIGEQEVLRSNEGSLSLSVMPMQDGRYWTRFKKGNHTALSSANK